VLVGQLDQQVARPATPVSAFLKINCDHLPGVQRIKLFDERDCFERCSGVRPTSACRRNLREATPAPRRVDRRGIASRWMCSRRPRRWALKGSAFIVPAKQCTDNNFSAARLQSCWRRRTCG
jgi:hypothetical protein